ncbi:PspC domain-containing protein [Spirosoma soli]|uniref:PspC domain-containing protein n=1 Tax=Spirosoma soli TaxID=1770529 RepID=A0ABW5M1C9_9BACT
MKKTISINISGVIFHIEEDGYDKLKNYLTSVQQYFSTYEDSQEIVTDIENRIAEKLLAKLKAADKQAVSLEDVNELVAAMGTVADFEAVEEEEVLVAGGGRNSAFSEGPGTGSKGFAGTQNVGGTPPPYRSNPAAEPRRLVRDLRRKTLGGVAAGLAYYFNMDVVWVRLIFVTLFVGLPSLAGATNGPDEFFGSVSGFTLFAYIAMWIALPGVVTIEEDKTVKKFFRNPDDKVLGGVASGIASYFGVDTGVIRLLFVLGIVVFGVGFLLYLVLWIISPQANTLTEKMEMQGQPITLSNIEHSIKQNLNINESPTSESTLTRILLFPFRAIATIISGLGSALGPLLSGVVSIIRVFAGILMLVIAFAFMIVCLTFLAAAIGLSSTTAIGPGGFPAELIRSDLSVPMVLSGFVAGIIPAFGLAILGIMLITTRNVLSSRTALTLAGVWLVSLVIFGGTTAPLINSFQRRATVEENKVLNVPAAVPTFALNDVDDDYDNWDIRPSIELLGYEGATLNLVQKFRAQGSNRAEAQANARQTKYVYTVKDSVVRFDNALELLPKAHWRGQDLDMELMIPYEKPFRMTKDFARYIRNEFGEKEIDRMDASLWKFTKVDGLVCINFPREKNRDADSEDNDVTDLTDDVQNAVANELGDDFDDVGSNTRQFNVSAFSKVDVGGAFVVRFRKGTTYKVVADGREEDLEDIEVKVNGSTLDVSVDRKGIFDWGNRNRVGLTITVPSIDELKLSGASKASLVEFGNFNDLNIDMSGACRTVFDGDVKNLTIGLSGASNVVLRGRATQLEADLTGASKLDAMGMSVDKASVDASGASHANLGQVGSLDSETSGASKVTRQ